MYNFVVIIKENMETLLICVFEGLGRGIASVCV